MPNEIIIDGNAITDSELELAIRILETYADDVEDTEPTATNSIRNLRAAASALPRTVADWTDEYPNRKAD